MKNKYLNWLAYILVVAVLVLGYQYLNMVEIPPIKDGKVEGNYALENLLAVGVPLRCTFEKSDQNSRIVANLYTNQDNDVYADFRIETDISETSRFNSFFLIKDKTTYTWTSLSDLGYTAKSVRSASINASPEAQAQLIGLGDKFPYDCEVLTTTDPTLFEVPLYVKFSTPNS